MRPRWTSPGKRFHLASIVVTCFLLWGCAKERTVTDDPEAIEKARQEHIKTMQREAQEAGKTRTP